MTNVSRRPTASCRWRAAASSWATGIAHPEVVITSLIGPGPEADHGQHYFEPDQKWQLTEIAAHYERSGRRETYLGDWHSHPGAATGRVSYTDRRVLRRIINTPQARAETPLMAIFFGDRDGGWNLEMWCAQLTPRRLLWPKLVMKHLDTQLYRRS